MAGAKLERTRWPGIYRRGPKWVYDYTDAQGKRRRGTADSREAASTHKAAEEERARRGLTSDAGAHGRLTVAAYALELYGADLDRAKDAKPLSGRYAGRRGAVRDSTRADYRRDVERYLLPELGRKRIAQVSPADLARLVAGLAARDDEHYRADQTIRRIYAPIAAMFAQAVEEGVIAHNPARDVRLPSGRDRLRRFDEDEDDEDPRVGRARALTREQLGDFLGAVDAAWCPFFELLAVSGLRISEAIALQWRHVALDATSPHVKVRQRIVRGKLGPPKSRHGRRDVPIPRWLVRELRERRASSESAGDPDPVFPSTTGTPLIPGNVFRRTLKPAASAAGVPWIGFHSFRHTCASMLIEERRNIVQVSRMLGHHSPAFTLDVYTHLMDDGVGAALELEGVTSGSRPAVRRGSLELVQNAANR